MNGGGLSAARLERMHEVMAGHVVAINTRRDELATTPGRYGWDGGWGTSWYVDPQEELIGILMTQRVWDATGIPKVLVDFWTSVYQAIDD